MRFDLNIMLKLTESQIVRIARNIKNIIKSNNKILLCKFIDCKTANYEQMFNILNLSPNPNFDVKTIHWNPQF